MKLTPERFMQQLENVIKWNSIKGAEDFSCVSIEKQAGYAREEIRETMTALLASDDAEILDGVADIFVTYGYKLYQMAHVQPDVELEEVVKASFRFVKNQELEAFAKRHERHLAEMDCLYAAGFVCQSNDFASNFKVSDIDILIQLLTLTELNFCKDIMAVIEHVMDSNWSKFPKIGSVDVYKECVEIEIKNAGRYSNVTPIINREHGVVVFRSDYGTGKIMKPSTFFEPNCKQFL